MQVLSSLPPLLASLVPHLFSLTLTLAFWKSQGCLQHSMQKVERAHFHSSHLIFISCQSLGFKGLDLLNSSLERFAKMTTKPGVSPVSPVSLLTTPTSSLLAPNLFASEPRAAGVQEEVSWRANRLGVSTGLKCWEPKF